MLFLTVYGFIFQCIWKQFFCAASKKKCSIYQWLNVRRVDEKKNCEILFGFYSKIYPPWRGMQKMYLWTLMCLLFLLSLNFLLVLFVYATTIYRYKMYYCTPTHQHWKQPVESCLLIWRIILGLSHTRATATAPVEPAATLARLVV